VDAGASLPAAAGLAEHGVEHLGHEALLGARQPTDPFELLE
jgi:hypothetical protein